VKSSKRTAIELSPATFDPKQAEAWLKAAGHGKTDGVVAKRRDDPYIFGERAMVKVKRMRTADCVVGGFRYLANKSEVGSLLLGLYDDGGRLHHVGFTSTIANKERGTLTRRLQMLREPPGFTGNAPGGPSRWSTERSGEWEPLRPEMVVEVRFDHMTGARFRHGTKLLRWRPDKAPRQCRFDQVS
jgi:ATP-dependent DNA ligase